MAKKTKKIDYRKSTLKVVEELLRESFEQTFLHSSDFSKKIVTAILSRYEEAVPGWKPKHSKIYGEFIQKKSAEIAKEVYNRKIDTVIENIMVNLGSIATLFSDVEMQQIYKFSKSPVGMKIIRNFDIMRITIKDGTILMGEELLKAWQNPKTTDEVENFVFDLINSF